MNWILYGSITLALLIAEIVYLQLAIYYRIVDTPNYRSAHSRLTVRGGGIIFWLAAFFSFIINDFASPIFFAGLTLVALISFLDDIYSVSNRLRLVVQLISVALLLLQTGFWQETVWWLLPGLVVACGVLNTFNFMDGINGITAFYSTVTVATLVFINRFRIPFTDPVLPVFALISLAVFAFFNARRQARCFAGDVGSVSMGFIVIFLLVSLLRESRQLAYSLLLAVYGIDCVMTILSRLLGGENIFQPHKLHLYQLLVHRLKWPHLRVAFLYALLQMLINILVLALIKRDEQTQFLGSMALLGLLAFFHWLLKSRLLNPSQSAGSSFNGKQYSTFFEG